VSIQNVQICTPKTAETHGHEPNKNGGSTRVIESNQHRWQPRPLQDG
jgi:hypothetical protein